MSNFKHWRLEREADDSGVAWAILDTADSSTNTLGADVMAELGLILDECAKHPPKGLIFTSAKEAGFIAGANIEEFVASDTPEKALALVKRGWDLYNRLAAVSYPTLALVRGHCMGGGTELALACRYRIAVDEPGTRFALPEVMLGIVPGWGGMLRLPQIVGPAAAFDMMLTGKNIDAKRAKKMGLADECLPPRVMENAARMLVLSGKPMRQSQLLLMQRLMNGPLKGFVASGAKKQVAKRARREHYPAPYAIIDQWQNHGGNTLAVPAGAPISLDALVTHPTTRNLIRVFFLQDRLKGFGKLSGQTGKDFAPRHVHVVGAGVMGGDIAAWCALRGMTVTLQDQSVERIAPAVGRAAKFFEKKLRDRKLARFALDRLIADPRGDGVRQADVIIEAIFENLEAKQALFADIEARAKPEALLASNTSSLKLADIAAKFKDPSRLVGIHFFNPVAMMPLVEVVAGAGTAPEAAQKAAAFVRKIDKLPLPVKDAPGFLVNAVLAPYMNEAMKCVDEGIAPETIDAAMLAFGMPMGPIELADTVGLDVAVAAGRQLVGDANPPQKLVELVEGKKLGKKSGQGFYTWIDGKAQKSKVGAGDTANQALAQRLITPLLDATQRLVKDGVVADAELADAGVIFGTGFAPYTGGPMNYLQTHRA
ncbi:3-hydroxyacyl-CoA dehydrogenase NAD-binding domain-containing protein [Sulfuritalea hydrogenivorans]|uniref:Alpha-subunit of fatty acid oxidation complex n=1 Tax=Sulfuritalea hydrogenivorans sk43H TaxID=1223802 RepID=W0SDT5_9PROT|nr:3-hydroxyacyl-CoA dehydrogenase NAD-binding domain-containing protein [Sulfuritalea hydrogenivorans]BAO27893.1 alpha-subunit of fatty acid oxidation complex [Sulfuritalea hydrogenivorans sk43H]